MSEKSLSIYDYLSECGDRLKNPSEQLTEEIHKARQIVQDKSGICKEKIQTAESHAFFRGAIRFLFTNENGDTVWSKYDVKWENAQKYFDENGVKGDYKRNSVLLRWLVYSFNKWEHFWKPKYDNTSDNWRSILLAQELRHPVDFILTNVPNVPDEAKLDNFVSELEMNDYQKSVHTEMVSSLLLSGICNGCKLVWRPDWDKTYVLYPANCRKEEHFYLFNKRNEILQDSRFVCCQKLDNANFFWGKEVKFTYNSYSFCWQESNWVDMYDGEVKLYDKGGEYTTLHTQFNGEDEFKFTDTKSLIAELDRCIKEYEEIQ